MQTKKQAKPRPKKRGNKYNEKVDRNQTILRLRLKGWSYGRLSTRYEMTKVRIRFIVKREEKKKNAEQN